MSRQCVILKLSDQLFPNSSNQFVITCLDSARGHLYATFAAESIFLTRYGTTSLGIHIKACEKKWQNEQMLKPPRERRPCPRPPTGFDSLMNGKGTLKQSDLDQFNEAANNNFRNQALVQCEYCNRKFKPESLVKHQKLCMKDPSTFKREQPPPKMVASPTISKKGPDVDKMPIGKSSQPPPPAYTDQGELLVKCGYCDRNFRQGILAKHQKRCAKDPQMFKKPEPSKPQPPPKKKEAAKGKGGKDPLWKIQHQQFQQAMKQMRLVKKVQQQGGDLRSIPMPKSNYDHYIQCDYCGRKFASDVAERHIPKCASIINKPKGITPSTIGSKYIANTGVGHINTKPSTKPKETPTRPIEPKGKVQSPQFGKLVRR